MVGHGGSSAGTYLADPTSPIPSHCASIVVTNILRVNSNWRYVLDTWKHYICDAVLCYVHERFDNFTDYQIGGILLSLAKMHFQKYFLVYIIIFQCCVIRVYRNTHFWPSQTSVQYYHDIFIIVWNGCQRHSTRKPVTTILTYSWKCTVLHCNHLGNTWKPLVLMTRHFDYCPSASEGDNQSVRKDDDKVWTTAYTQFSINPLT